MHWISDSWLRSHAVGGVPGPDHRWIDCGNLTVAQAYIADVTEAENRAKSFGIIGIAFGMGFLLGPGISGFLAQFDNAYPIFAAAALSFTSIMCTYFLLPSVVPHPHPELEGGMSRWGSWSIFQRRSTRAAPLAILRLHIRLQHLLLGVCAFRRAALYAQRIAVRNQGSRIPVRIFRIHRRDIQGGGMGRLVKMFGESRLVQAGFATMALSFALWQGFTAFPCCWSRSPC